MIAQIGLSSMLAGVILYAWIEYRRAPFISMAFILVTLEGLYFIWMPQHATWLAALMGIGRGVDLILYVWVIISLTAMLNIHLKLRSQMQFITVLAREVALANARMRETGETVRAAPIE
jgi:small membrane protein